MRLERKPPSGHEPEARYQPPPLVKKRRIKRSCSEWEVLVLMLSMEASNDEGETLDRLQDCMNRRGEPSTKIALGIPGRSAGLMSLIGYRPNC
jgi:hypothetical protein